MSLKAFHLVFITAASGLAFGFGVWLVHEYAANHAGVWDLIGGIASFAASVGLVFYERYFLKKTKNVSFL